MPRPRHLRTTTLTDSPTSRWTLGTSGWTSGQCSVNALADVGGRSYRQPMCDERMSPDGFTRSVLAPPEETAVKMSARGDENRIASVADHPRGRGRVCALAMTSVFALGFGSLVATPAFASADGTGVVINEAYLSGGSAGAAFTNKFVELYN